jgi:DNA-binding IclR family transcriptional regulator
MSNNRVVEANWTRKVEILKAATNPEVTLSEISRQMDISKGTISHTVNEFANLYMLTKNEKDFPRKILRIYRLKHKTIRYTLK